MNTWDPDVPLDVRSISEIVQRRFPEFTRFQPLGQGWDNVAVLANDSTVFRLPHRKLGAECVLNEIVALPFINKSLNIPIPEIQLIGEPAEDYPYHFIGYPILKGHSADSTMWSQTERLDLIEPLARALLALHATTIPDLPGDILHRKDPTALLKRITDRIDNIPADKIPLPKESIHSWASEVSESIRPTKTTTLVHGDLYPRHLLVDEAKNLTGIIDWGDVHIGHPAIDLSIAYTFIPPEGRGTFFSVYGSINEDDKLLAKLRACMYGCALLHYGVSLPDKNSELMGTTILTELQI